MAMDVSRQIYLNGQLVPSEQAVVSVFDHGYLYGDGVFEGIRIYDGVIFRLDEHLERLYDSAKSILMTIPIAYEEMAQAVMDLRLLKRQKRQMSTSTMKRQSAVLFL